jgi:hypothetical protein
MDFCPKFWIWIDDQFANGILGACMAVHDELIDGNDELAKWAEDRKDSGFFIPASQEMQSIVGDISEHVMNKYPRQHAEVFLAKADPWVIAHGKVSKLTVVTNEGAVNMQSTKPKIPNICKIYSVQNIDSITLLRLLKPPFMSK